MFSSRMWSFVLLVLMVYFALKEKQRITDNLTRFYHCTASRENVLECTLSRKEMLWRDLKQLALLKRNMKHNAKVSTLKTAVLSPKMIEHIMRCRMNGSSDLSRFPALVYAKRWIEGKSVRYSGKNSILFL